MARMAYKSVPGLQWNQVEPLKLPDVDYGVPRVGFMGWATLAILGFFTTVCLLSFSASIGETLLTIVGLTGPALAITVFASIRWWTKYKLEEQAHQSRLQVREAYVKNQLLPYLSRRYGIESVKNAELALGGSAFTALIDGSYVNVILVETSTGSKLVELAFYNGSVKVEDDKAPYVTGGDGGFYYFPFSVDSHSSHGDGSAHSSHDGNGSFSDSGGDGGGGDGGGGDGGGGGGGGGD